MTLPGFNSICCNPRELCFPHSITIRVICTCNIKSAELSDWCQLLISSDFIAAGGVADCVMNGCEAGAAAVNVNRASSNTTRKHCLAKVRNCRGGDGLWENYSRRMISYRNEHGSLLDNDICFVRGIKAFSHSDTEIPLLKHSTRFFPARDFFRDTDCFEKNRSGGSLLCQMGCCSTSIRVPTYQRSIFSVDSTSEPWCLGSG